MILIVGNATVNHQSTNINFSRREDVLVYNGVPNNGARPANMQLYAGVDAKIHQIYLTK